MPAAAQLVSPISTSPRAGKSAAEAEHDRRVDIIAADVRQHIGSGERVHVCKGGVHHVVPLPGDRRFRSRPIDVSGLNHVLAIDVEGRTCSAEPGVSFAAIVDATLPHGLVPIVVPELEGITLGGAVAGCSVESMSFRHGGFHDTCLEYELVSGSGDIVTCSRDHQPFLFDMIHGSYGTLGILTRLTFRLIPARPFVKMEYVRLPDAPSFHAEMLARMADPGIDFIDGIVHGPDCQVLCLGRFVDQCASPSSYRGEQIFYKSTRRLAEDTLTTRDYFFRYDTECHWMTSTVPPLEWPLVRRLVGRWFLGSTNLITWSGRLDRLMRLKRRPEVVCDVFIPSHRFVEFSTWYERTFDYYPLWTVPYRISKMYPWVAPEHARHMGGELFIDCAIYGKPNSEPDVDYSRLLEEETYSLGGIKTLISRNHYTPERFWSIYHRDNVTRAKQQLDPHGVFPGMFEKLHRVG